MVESVNTVLTKFSTVVGQLQEVNTDLQNKVFAFIKQLGEATQYYIPQELGFKIEKENGFISLSFQVGGGSWHTIVTNPELSQQILEVEALCNLLVVHSEGTRFLEWLERLATIRKNFSRFFPGPTK